MKEPARLPVFEQEVDQGEKAAPHPFTDREAPNSAEDPQGSGLMKAIDLPVINRIFADFGGMWCILRKRGNAKG